jgi:hypothetical protein
MKTIKIGIATITAAADTSAMFVVYLPEKLARPNGAVVWLIVKTRARKNSFQLSANVSTVNVRIAGRANGTMIFQRVFQLDAPSIRAASYSDGGADRNAARIQKMPKATSPETSSRINAQYVSSRPIARTS